MTDKEAMNAILGRLRAIDDRLAAFDVKQTALIEKVAELKVKSGIWYTIAAGVPGLVALAPLLLRNT